MGVWIETLIQNNKIQKQWSHPVWVCGLKQNNSVILQSLNRVTPCMGVWIETRLRSPSTVEETSHPVWVCGLKLIFCLIRVGEGLSHPVWVCGLKLLGHYRITN